ncbi:centromere protein V isoform X1 [Gymnodraco acuticeps]|uniref:Centromere protein V isoform X1 n=2 Tax=Gymnodraco acuticeps TaxID=8218 RepID=A0A6P8VF10_GYMAC|nr:centromere protein V isoform X1 [Gymnodraco acuticeps]
MFTHKDDFIQKQLYGCKRYFMRRNNISLYTTVLEFSRTAVATETVLELLIGLHDCLFCQRLVAVLQMDLVKHTGGCHCGAVRFEVLSSPDLHVFQCNCSICTKKQNHHFIVPKNHFTLLQGSDYLITYTFNTHIAKHTFCKTCGVQSFYTPRSNPDGYGVAPHCLDPGTVRSVTVETFCGEKWEESMQAHKSIRDMSKPEADAQLKNTQ